MKTRILVVDDHPVVRLGLRAMLEAGDDVAIVGEASTGEEALQMVDRLSPDIVLMDLGARGMSGVEATRRLKASHAQVAVIAFTFREDEESFFQMLGAGASGYVPTRAAPEELLAAIRTVAGGEVYLHPSLAKLLVRDYLKQDRRGSPQVDGLSAREREVLALLAEGKGNAAIGEQLGISHKTVARHRENIMHKLGLRARTDLVKYAVRKGLVRAPME